MRNILANGFYKVNSPKLIFLKSRRLSNISMKTIDAIRHENLMTLIKHWGSIQAFATAVDKSHAQISQLKNRSVHSKSGKPRMIGDELAREIEQKCDLPSGWMDSDHSAQMPVWYVADAPHYVMNVIRRIFDLYTTGAPESFFDALRLAIEIQKNQNSANMATSKKGFKSEANKPRTGLPASGEDEGQKFLDKLHEEGANNDPRDAQGLGGHGTRR